jgi:hypothetical protein
MPSLNSTLVGVNLNDSKDIKGKIGKNQKWSFKGKGVKMPTIQKPDFIPHPNAAAEEGFQFDEPSAVK